MEDAEHRLLSKEIEADAKHLLNLANTISHGKDDYTVLGLDLGVATRNKNAVITENCTDADCRLRARLRAAAYRPTVDVSRASASMTSANPFSIV